MLHFIPAWYQQDEWCENEQIWYKRRTHTEFDDTVKQIQLFHRSGAFPYQILLLSYTPNLRHFLHRQGVFHAPYWSCFDAIQQIRRKKVSVLSFHDLNWPPGIEFIYSQFLVIAFLNGKKYAQAEFGEDGNLIQVTLYKDNKVHRRNLYDDRGFLSRTVLYEDEKPLYQDYLMKNGVWKLRHYQKDGHVEVNPKYPGYFLRYQSQEQEGLFSRLSYDGMDQVIYEVLSAYLRLTEKKDIFCVAMHGLHGRLLQAALKGKKVILSFFADRYLPEAHQDELGMLEKADYIIVDSGENERKVRESAGATLEHIAVIPPYDTRVDYGISQRLKIQKILVPADGLEEEVFCELIGALGEYLFQNENARVHLFTREAAYDRRDRLLEKTRDALRKAGFRETMALEKGAENVSENNLETEQEAIQRFFAEQCVDELAVSTCMREQRVLVDMRKVPELYLQIAALSFGLPQIVRTKTKFVEDGGNGAVLEDIKKLPDALDYYLDGLAHWNEARIHSYEMGKQYTTGRLLDMWREVMDSVG